MVEFYGKLLGKYTGSVKRAPWFIHGWGMMADREKVGASQVTVTMKCMHIPAKKNMKKQKNVLI